MICRMLKTCTENELNGHEHAQCDNNRKECIVSSDCRAKVKCEENRKKYVLDNTLSNHVILYHMDGGIIVEDSSIAQEIKKSDFLYVIDAGERTAILVELKGVNVSDALRQLQETLNNFKGYFASFQHVYGRVVAFSFRPALKATSEYMKLVKILREKYHGNLKIAGKELFEKDKDLCKA